MNKYVLIVSILITSIFAYILGCLTIKYNLFPYSIYKNWKYTEVSPFKKILESEVLFEMIKKGGYVIQFRHTHRDRMSMPKVPLEVDLNYSCDEGANLSVLGKEQAKWIRSNLIKFKIPIEEIYSSPSCRLKEMAEILFPSTSVNYSNLLFYDRVLNEHQKIQKKDFIQELLSRPLSGANNRFILGHQGTFRPSGKDLKEGHAHVYKPNSNNRFEYLGEINLSTWIP